MLFINPHQPFFGVGQWYEGQVHSDEGWNMSGASFFGSAFPTLGHNSDLGWSHTVNRPDILDVYEETFDSASDPLAYRYDGAYRKAIQWTDTIRVKTASGLVSRSFTFRKTHHGPILAQRGGKYLAVKLAKFEEGGQMEEWYAMSRAHNLAEFKQAMSAVAVPMFNTMYADRSGNIYYVYNGAVPKRDPKFDWLKPVDGSTPATEWHGYHDLADLPQITNPGSHFMQNCNSTPFTTTVDGNPDPSRYPPYMVGEGDTARARMSRRILYNRSHFSFDDWAKAGFDTEVLEAGEQLPKLRQDWLAAKTSNDPLYRKLEPVMREFDLWDRTSRVDSVAMTVFMLWYEKQFGTAVIPKSQGQHTSLELLSEAVADLEGTFGTWRVPWGNLNRLERTQSGGQEPFSDAKPSLPIAGAPGDVGIVFNFYARPEKGQKLRYGVAGHSFISVIDFGPQIEARSVLVFGDSADPHSPHYFDQAQLYQKVSSNRPGSPSTRLNQHTESIYHPGEAPTPPMNQTPLVAIYPGSFDPITNGHLDLIERGSRLADSLIVSTLRNEEKRVLFSVEERIEMLQEAVRPFPNVEVASFHGLLVDFASQVGAHVILRGIRAISDYEYELQMALMNRRLRPEVETVFLMAGEAYSFISSRLVKEVIALGGNISGLVPPFVEQRLKERLL